MLRIAATACRKATPASQLTGSVGPGPSRREVHQPGAAPYALNITKQLTVTRTKAMNGAAMMP